MALSIGYPVSYKVTVPERPPLPPHLLISLLVVPLMYNVFVVWFAHTVVKEDRKWKKMHLSSALHSVPLLRVIL